MRLRRYLAGGVVVGLGVVGVLVSLAAADVLAELGIGEADAKGRVIQSLNTGYVNFSPAGKAFKAAAPAVREALVKGVLTWAKAYTESPEFKTAYAKLRENQKPEAPGPPGSVDDQLKQQRAKMEQTLEEEKKNLANIPTTLPPDTQEAIKEGMEAGIKMTTAQLAEMDTPEYKAMTKERLDAQNATEQQQFQKRMKEYEASYPTDPRSLIAKRLKRFLDESATVDFGAKLVAAGGTMRFADAKYEENSPEWKLCYRAGKEAVDAARVFATAWVAELEKK